MIWRSNITVWNSHDVLLLLFTSTLGVIIEVNIFYTNTIPRWAVFYWGGEAWVQAANIYIVLLVWWCPEGSKGQFGGIYVWPGEENFTFCVSVPMGSVCVRFQCLKYWTVRCPKCSVKSKCGHSCCSQCEVGTQTENLGSEAAKGDCLEHHSNISTNKKGKKSQLPEVGNALGPEMKMSKNLPRYLAHCLFLQIHYRKINSSFSALWDVPINTLSIYRVRSLVRNRCCNLSVGLCL